MGLEAGQSQQETFQQQQAVERSELVDVQDVLSSYGHEDLSSLISALESGDLQKEDKQRTFTQLDSAFHSYMQSSPEMAPTLEYCLQAVKDQFPDYDSPRSVEERAAVKEECIANFRESVQKVQTATSGVSDPYYPVRYHLFEGDDRPDPALRTLLFYGDQVQAPAKGIAYYTQHSLPELNFLGRSFRKSFAKKEPVMGGGLATVTEIGKGELLANVSRNYLDDNSLNHLLDQSYEGAVGLATNFLKVFDVKNAEKSVLRGAESKLGQLLGSKGLFDASSNVLAINVVKNNDAFQSSVRDETYDKHFPAWMERYHEFKGQLKGFKDYMVSDLGVSSAVATQYYEKAIATALTPQVGKVLEAYETIGEPSEKHLNQQNQFAQLAAAFASREAKNSDSIS